MRRIRTQKKCEWYVDKGRTSAGSRTTVRSDNPSGFRDRLCLRSISRRYRGVRADVGGRQK